MTTLTFWFLARGTTEPGTFGLIVGDPLVRRVKAELPGCQAYAVQVRNPFIPIVVSY
jgi:hypothetical protein